MRSILSFVLVLFINYSNAQIEFEEGYIIDRQGNKYDVLIKNSDWSNNPSEFLYKKTAEAKVETGTLNSINEFSIPGIFKYVKHDIEIDRSSNVTRLMSRTKEPEFKNETQFLKYLVEGEASLFQYQDNNVLRFFYSISNNSPLQLVNKKYRISASQVAKNEGYKKQLYENLSCESITVDDTRRTSYDKNDLITIFEKYNNCKGVSTTTYLEEAKKGKFKFGLKAGLVSSSLSVRYDEGDLSQDRQSVEFDDQLGLRIGAEIEYILPFNKNKWSIFLEPGYQSFSDSKEVETESTISTFMQIATVDYKFIDVPLGLRHNMYINENSKLFLNGAFVFVFDMSEKIDYSETNNSIDLDINSSANLAFGIGYELNGRYSVEIRVNTDRNITRDYAFFNSPFKSIGVIAGYKL